MLEELTVEEPIVELKRDPNYKKQPKRDDELWKGILAYYVNFQNPEMMIKRRSPHEVN